MGGRIAVLLLAMIGVARGDDHDFQTLDRLTPTTTAGVSAGLAVAGTSDVDAGVGGELWAHYVHASGAGGYLVFPASYVAVDGDDQSALGNAELGALYTREIAADVDLIGHVGVALDYEHQGIAPLQYVAAIPRYGDLVQRWGFTTWLRFGASYIGHSGQVFWRADLGLDLMVDDHDGMGKDIDPIVRTGAAAGYAFGSSEATLEVVTAVTDSDANRAAATIAAGWRVALGRWNPGVAVIVPVLFDAAPLSEIAVAFAISVAVRFP